MKKLLIMIMSILMISGCAKDTNTLINDSNEIQQEEIELPEVEEKVEEEQKEEQKKPASETVDEAEDEVLGYDKFGTPVSAQDFELMDRETIESLIDAGTFGEEILEEYDKYHSLSGTEKEEVVEDKLQEQFEDYEQNILPNLPEEQIHKPGDKVEVMPGVTVEIPEEPQTEQSGGTLPSIEVTFPPGEGPGGYDTSMDGSVPPNTYDYNSLSKESQELTDKVREELINGK